MKTTLLLCFLATAALAQTPPATNTVRMVMHPAFVQYRVVTNQIAVVQRQIQATNAIYAARAKHNNLRREAGELSRDASRQEHLRARDQQSADLKPLELQLARLQLSAYEIKTKYGFDKLPKPAPAKK